jgi:hypothetical protein
MTTAATTIAPETDRFTSARNPKGIEPSSAALLNEGQRTNVPYNARAWDHVEGLDEEDRDLLSWFHLHALAEGYSNTRIGEFLGFDRTNAGRILAGTYNVKDWSGIIGKIRDYRARTAPGISLAGIEHEPRFVVTEAAEMFMGGLDYASRGGFALLAGPSGVGKTKTCAEWDARNPGRMIRINAPATGGHVALIRRLAKRIGVSHRKYSTSDILLSLDGRLDRRHVLCIDQGSRLIPTAKQIQAKALEVLMDINEETGCGIVIPLTWRAVETMADLRYQIEQITGRAEIFRAPDPTPSQIADIASQYGKFDRPTITALHALAIRPGGLRTVAKVLNLAVRMAKVEDRVLSSEYVAEAIKNRFVRMGGKNPFDKD